MADTATTTPRPTAVDLLTAARALLTPPGSWTYGVGARDAEGAHINVDSPLARCFCIRGALLRAAIDSGAVGIAFHDAEQHAIRLLEDAMPQEFADIITFNDAPNRTQEDVLLLIDTVLEANHGG